ncbi:MAG TPA: peptidoglycan DD-metalloendopeptidase family protein [Candidatus Saccharibacteria bacterium]|nr:peptidoglycan DD-metalloendopeptidase family protein [Candidatus Saccharibacteria bacterium]HPR09972.1 peptidoglycan DD-metalloendopeptidase family protein [Candidatus Saccharibacteria bacterium]
MSLANRNGRTTWVPHSRAKVTKKYGVKDSQYSAGHHTGTDIAIQGSSGQKIIWAPSVKGKVVRRGYDPNGYGNYVVIKSENNRQWLLAHMRNPGPRVGTVLNQGDKIGNIGATGNVSGPHLHLEEGKKNSPWVYGEVKKPKLLFGSEAPTRTPNGHTLVSLDSQSNTQNKKASDPSVRIHNASKNNAATTGTLKIHHNLNDAIKEQPKISNTITNVQIKEVDISTAAQKSQAIMVADLNKDGVVTKKEDSVLNAADRNESGVVSKKELNRFVAVADVNKDGIVVRTEAKAFKTVDSNDDHKISKKELKAFKSIAGKDGEISRKEAKQALKAQIDSKQDQREHDLAVEYLRRTSKQSGGSQEVGNQAAALVNAQQNKPKKQDNDGPGKKKKK